METNEAVTQGSAANEALSFEKVWAMFQETDRQMKETDRLFKKLREDSNREWKKASKLVGGLGNRFGKLAEHMVVPNIEKKFNDLGFHFKESAKNKKIWDHESGKILAEIDILLENDDTVIALEIKVKPEHKDVDDHVDQMEVLRRSGNRAQDPRKYLGAIAGAIMEESVRAYILKKGFYVIEQTGDTMQIYAPEGFKPREW